MRHASRVGAVLSAGAVLLAQSVNAGLVDPSLDTVLQDAADDDIVSALVYLVDQVDTSNVVRQLTAEKATRNERHATLVTMMQDLAAATSGALLTDLADREQTGGIASYKAYWLVNAVRVDGRPADIRAIAARPDVSLVYLNFPIEGITPVGAVTDYSETAALGGPEIGVIAVRAPEVWAMGYDGSGVLVATLDTGVDGNHPALASRWRGLDPAYANDPEWAWFDPVTNTEFPQAFGAHGTHTMGSMCGGAPGDEVGCAPGVEWIHAATIDRVSIPQTVSDSFDAYEWMADPDGNPSTDFDVPQVCTNSWGLVTGHGYSPCDETLWSVLDALEAVGTIVVFAAGNEGGQGLRRPSDRATDDFRTFAVASVNANNPSWPLAGSSSRGPTNCTPDGRDAIKPEISAPGVSVRSSFPGGGYGVLSGTSMAAPHIGGVMALMLDANPNLTVEQVKQIVSNTAFDLGDPGNDNSYGKGMIDAVLAVQRALDLSVGCEGDVDESDIVGFSDLLLVLSAWGNVGGAEDLDANGVVGFSDLLYLLSRWGPC